MNINQIKYVLEIYRTSSMRAAAEKLFVTQPALSASIRELEQELGITIFERSNRGVSITTEGREFLTYAKKAAAQYEIIEERYLSKDRNKEKFSVSTQHFSFSIKAFANVLRQFSPEKYIFSIYETKTNKVLKHVRDLKSEVGIVSYTEDNEKIIKKLIKEYGLSFFPLMKKDTYVYLWENHELAGRKSISLRELEAYPYISFDQESEGEYYLHEEAMQNNEFEKEIKSTDRAVSMELIASLQGYSIGTGILGENDAILKGLISVKLKEDDPLMIGYIIRRHDKLSKFGKAYVEELLKYKEL
ncbi:MAG: LysR family transcriptional regulator [Eubacteriales bacterium]|nr:LysR family transcriptional regulator [Eubacteriales bacterium]